MAPARAEILERERRWALPAGIAAILVVPLFLGSLFIEGGSSVGALVLPTEQFRAVEEDSGTLLFSAVVRGLSFVLWTIPLLYLFRAAQARSERVSGMMVGFIFIGPLLFSAYVVLSNIAQTQVASDFAAQADAGGDIYTLLEDIGDDSTLAAVGSNLFFPAILGAVVAMVYVPLQALRVGLLTRFFATLGMALGVGLLVFAPAPMALAIWFGWLGFVILDRTPRGRPPAWDAGVAVPWPRPGEEPAEPEPEPGSEEVVEGDATEIVSPSAKDHSARRERAKKRKRKRRR